MVTIKIDHQQIAVDEQLTILEAAKEAHIEIPHLCYLRDINEIGACRVCVVELQGKDKLVTACNTVVQEGMVIYTNSPKVRYARRCNVELLLSQHDCECAYCSRSGNCSLQKISNDLGITSLPYEKKVMYTPWNQSFPLIRESNKCIKCMRCIQICDKVQNLQVWDVQNTGSRTTVNVSLNRSIEEAECSLCGQCITHCPVNALHVREDSERAFAAFNDPDKITIVQIAPAVRAAWGESLGLRREEATIEKLGDAFRRMGADYVFDTDFAADLTIMEEGTELLQRIGKYLKGDQEVKMPLMTSCCPGWVSFVEQHFPELLDNLSTAKSPQQMFGAIAKSYFAEKLGVDRKRIVVVSIMPCLAKKYEASRPEFAVDGNPDVDISIYTRELARLIRYANINFAELPDSDFDRPLGESTGAGVIFGTTGGVIEAACRTAYELYTKKTLPKIDFEELRGLEGIRSATIDFDGTPIKIGIAHGLGNARRLVEEVKNGMSPYHAIEVMACPGGCIGGGGQPFHRGRMEVLRKRAAALYQEDRSKTLRKSHENPYIQALYADYLGEPCGPRAHKLLHTHYFDRKEAINMFTQENQEG